MRKWADNSVRQKIVQTLKHSKTILTALTTCFAACTSIFDNGTNTLLKEKDNPRISDKAIVFIHGGNATTDNSIHILLTGYEHDLNDKDRGNIFVADSDHGKIVIDSSTIDLSWQSDDSLTITYDKKLRVFE